MKILSLFHGNGREFRNSRSSQSGLLYEGRREMLTLGEKLERKNTFSGIALRFWLSGSAKKVATGNSQPVSAETTQGKIQSIAQMSAVKAKVRRRKVRSLLDDIRDIYEGIIVAGLLMECTMLLTLLLLSGESKDAIFNTVSRYLLLSQQKELSLSQLCCRKPGGKG